jgi:Fe-S-cluster containining protein
MPKQKKNKEIEVIDCCECQSQKDCCQFGAWLDLEEAKKIATLGLKGEFFQLEQDKDFPSGFRIGTSYGDSPCTFLDPDGLCSVHKIDYGLKPNSCKEFPYENNKLAPLVDVLCSLFKSKIKKQKRNKK